MTATHELETRLARTLRAGARGVLVTTDEEVRAIAMLEEVGRALHWPVHCWSATAGVDGDRKSRSLHDALAAVRVAEHDAIWVLLDASAHLDAVAIRAIRELAQRVEGPALVLLEHQSTSALAKLPELVREPLPLPDHDELAQRVGTVATALADGGWADAVRELGAASNTLATAGLGLGLVAFERLLAEAVLTHQLDTTAIARFITTEKPRVLGEGGLVDLVEASPADRLGGLAHLKAWLRRRKPSFDPAAAAAGIVPARGCLLVGVQGCGKSLTARVCAGELALPLVRLEPGRIFGGTVGESEANLRRVVADVDRMAPVVLWIDELDKGFAGADGAASDGGTAARVLGGLLTWLQERTRPVFVVATANRIDVLPAELLRRGRFDDIFFVDLPDADEREAILRVPLVDEPARRGAKVELPGAWSQWAALARAAEGTSGAELAAAVAEARLAAWADRRALQPDDFRDALAQSVPLSVLRKEDVAALRAWAHGRARRA
ncbi:MAG TPA: AAA family ATPase [Nannocystaceae bacterium]|nr:AAA family ATPase [Nannocystaceae bacterium]